MSHKKIYADAGALIEEILNQLQKLNIAVPKPAEVRDYLDRYPDIIDLLSSVCSVTRERFGMDAQLSLEVYRDPEINYEYLVLYIRQEHYDEQTMRMLKDIWATYDEKLAERPGWLHVTTNFRPPREVHEKTDSESRFAGLDLDYYKRRIPPEQLHLLMDFFSYSAPGDFDPEEIFYPEDL